MSPPSPPAPTTFPTFLLPTSPSIDSPLLHQLPQRRVNLAKRPISTQDQLSSSPNTVIEPTSANTTFSPSTMNSLYALTQPIGIPGRNSPQLVSSSPKLSSSPIMIVTPRYSMVGSPTRSSPKGSPMAGFARMQLQMPPPNPVFATYGSPLKSQTSSRPVANATIPSAVTDDWVDLSRANSPSFIRKKNGEVVRSSLKKAGSKSEPTTPTCPKYVHFDTQLERVKLFIQEQTPDSLSRPESEDESDFDESDEEEDDDDEEGTIVLSLPNFPTLSTWSFNQRTIGVESVMLSQDKRFLQGVIQVHNIAFQKIVTVRYTFDFWQTNSEINAVFKESVKRMGGPTNPTDRFTFSIPLEDNQRASGSEYADKTMCFAVRYQVAGREFWDNNNGMNYVAEFRRSHHHRRHHYRSTDKHSSNARNRGNFNGSIGGNSNGWAGRSTQDAHLADILGTSPSEGYPRSSQSALSTKGKPNSKKMFANRYDFDSSLSAAMKQQMVISSSPPSRSPFCPPSYHISVSTVDQFYTTNPYIEPFPSIETPLTGTSWDDHSSLTCKLPNYQTTSLPISIPPKQSNGHSPHN